MSNLVQCFVCQRWLSNQHELLIHFRFCWEQQANNKDNRNHLLQEHHPLKFCNEQGEQLNPFAVYDGLDLQVLTMGLLKIDWVEH